MPAHFERGSFSVSLRFEPLQGELAEADRQCAWEFYLEVVARLALCGRLGADGVEDSFEGELFYESLDSVRVFAEEALAIARRYPVGKIDPERKDHLGVFMARVVELAIRPFLEKWQPRFQHWWKRSLNGSGDPFALQEGYPHVGPLKKDWACIRRLCRAVAAMLQESYGFAALRDAVPPHVRNDWSEESRTLFKCG